MLTVCLGAFPFCATTPASTKRDTEGGGRDGGGEIRNVALVPFHLSMKRSTVRPLQAPPIGQSNATCVRRVPAVFGGGFVAVL